MGGGTGAGKSTLAHALAARHGLRHFALDRFWYAYEARARWAQQTADEQWLETPPEEQARQFEAVSRDMMRFALEDLAELPSAPTVVEGPQVLADLVPAGEPAVFLDPTPEWQRQTLEQRPMPSSDPARALANRLIKDRLYADRVARLAREHGFPVLVLDGLRDPVPEVEALVELPHGPTDLAAARRWENEAAAANVRAWLSTPDETRNPRDFAFVCECGRRGCDAHVRLTLAAFDAAQRVLAPGH